MADGRPVIAVIGGTGKLGNALARGWARAGYQIVIGSRDPARAKAAAAAIAQETTAQASGDSNLRAARQGGLLVVTVPYGSQLATLEEIASAAEGKILVDATVPLRPPKVARVQLPPEGSAAVAGQAMLGPGVSVVSAFHNVAAHKLAADGAVDCDVLVFGDSKRARQQVVALAEALGLRGLHGGPLANSAAAEAMTSLLIFINRTYSVDGAGVRITGELKPPQES